MSVISVSVSKFLHIICLIFTSQIRKVVWTSSLIGAIPRTQQLGKLLKDQLRFLSSDLMDLALSCTPGHFEMSSHIKALHPPSLAWKNQQNTTVVHFLQRNLQSLPRVEAPQLESLHPHWPKGLSLVSRRQSLVSTLEDDFHIWGKNVDVGRGMQTWQEPSAHFSRLLVPCYWLPSALRIPPRTKGRSDSMCHGTPSPAGSATGKVPMNWLISSPKSSLPLRSHWVLAPAASRAVGRLARWTQPPRRGWALQTSQPTLHQDKAILKIPLSPPLPTSQRIPAEATLDVTWLRTKIEHPTYSL